MPAAEEIVKHHEPDPTENPWVKGSPPMETIDVVPHDSRWPEQYLLLCAQIEGPDCPETIRHILFRDWLRSHEEDRALYERAKRTSFDGVDNVVDYNLRKKPVIREIYGRAFRAAGLL